MPTESERRWAAGAHLASIPGMALGLGFVGPLLVLWLRSRGSLTVRRHAVAAVNFNITVGLVGLASLITTASLARRGDDSGPDWASGATAAIIVLLTVYWFLFTVRAAMTARYGERCHYPLALPILRV
ncbi:DUF4870 domain-containing protein [Sporichthya sp.]|uniref:DUF4870 domain-containing protein n=1 Tax=Sporichthya sp. TaxID=65475 RepID=UPI00178FC72C|nr:DUF4870 domain-containing protein [Sporichthya sp.]MBA3745678.1 DUF4870 domain-containing protein [Sporichthya sp.]